MDNQTNYKAQFCRQYFTQLKSFIPKFDVKRNNLGMDFLTIIDEGEFKWDNTVHMIDKNLMLAIEEYYHITDTEELQEQRETLFSALINSDKFATDKNVKICFVDDVTIKAILEYFGFTFKEEKEYYIKDYIRDFVDFASKVAFETDNKSKSGLSFANYEKALRLFEYHRNNNAHRIIKQEIPKRKIAFQYLAFTYIGLVYLLRAAWYEKPERLTNYKKPDKFSIPKQSLHIIVNRQDSTNDNIVGYEFVPNMKKGIEERITVQVNPTPRLEITVPVRKYDKFKLIVKYGTPDNNVVNITFGDKGEQMLTYYYWNPTLNINLPSSSNILPGLSIGSDSTEELIAKLLDNVNKQQEGKAKDTVSDIVSNLLTALEPTLQRIKELSDKPKKTSDDEDKCKELIQKVDSALQKQLCKNEKNFLKILNKIDELKENQTEEFQKQTQKAEEHYKDLKDDILKLSEQTNKESINVVTRRKRYFMLCHLTWLVPLSFVIYFLTVYDGWDRNLLFLMNPWKYVFIAAICLLVPCFFITCIYYINTGNAFIKSRYKWRDFGASIFFISLYCLLFFVVPYPSVDKYLENYDFTIHNGFYHKKAAKLAENYLKDNEDSENARIMLAQYYLNYTKDIDAALKVTEPLKAGSKIGTFYAAMALYKHGKKDDFSQIRNILEMYSEEHKDTMTLDMLYLKGIMLMEGKGVKRDLMKSISYLLKAAAKNTDNDIRAKTMGGEVYAELGHILSNNLSGFNDDSLFTSVYESEVEIKSNNTKDTINIQPLNLPAATYFLKQVSSYKPIAAIDLGNIYKDLNMLDSALYYYDTAIQIAQDSLQKEAIFRKSLICEKMGISLSKKETSLLFAYKPARFHKAVQMMKNGNNDRNRLIEEFDASYDTSIVHKRLYIAPHVFIHIEKGDSLSALSILKNTRPEGNFNEEFVRGVKYILNGKDSIGLHWMTLSAEKGCNYAAMICYYKEMEYGPVILSKIQKMCSLGIPFANVLACKLLLQTDLYPLAYKYAAKAMALGHPAGALAIKLGDNFRLINEASDIENSSERQQGLLYGLRQLMQMGMRMASDKWILDKYIGENLSEKNFYLNDVIELDCIHYKQLERRNTMPQRNFRLWSDIAINNNCISAEIQLLAFAHRLNDIEYENKLLESAFSIVNEKDWIHDYGNLSLYIHGYKQPLYIDSLESVYKNNTFKQGLLSRSSFVDSLKKWQSYPYFKIFKDLRYLYTPLSGRSYFLQNHITLNNLYLLDEFVSYIDDDWYTRSIN